VPATHLEIGSITGSRILARWGSKLQESKPYTHGLSYFKESFQLPRNQKLERFEISAFCYDYPTFWENYPTFWEIILLLGKVGYRDGNVDRGSFDRTDF
jgi:hypothetical protein